MKRNLFFVFLFAVLVVLTSVAVSAQAELAEFETIEVNDAVVDNGYTAMTAGETLDMRLTFTAVTDEKDVRVKTWIEGYRDEIEAETERFDVYENRTYTKTLSLNLPLDLEIEEDYKLIIRVASKNKEDQERVQLTIQRPSYELEILSVDYVKQVDAGDSLQMNVVVKNRGSHEIEDIYVKARISELSIEKRVYAGDLAPEDCEGNCDDEDAVEKTIILSIPEGTASGEYEIEVKAYNDDTTVSTRDSIIVKGVEVTEEVEVLSEELTKDVEAGSTETYKIEILNPSDETKVITITTPSGIEEGINVKVTPEVISVPAESSQEVELEVETTKDLTSGTYTIPVEISSDEKVIKQVGITANVVRVKPKVGLRRPLFTSAVVLAIILIVLLIVLFTTVRKPSTPGEEETAYY
jgi:uncharacterized membrane protein